MLMFALLSFSVFAGDVAAFEDIGFSADGKYYVFGQYGKTDKKFQGWADIYQVDIEKNDYVSKGVFKIKPSAVTSDKSGLEVYESLEAKNFYYLKDFCDRELMVQHKLQPQEDLLLRALLLVHTMLCNPKGLLYQAYRQEGLDNLL